MATMNFSVPADLKNRFNQVFANANKSAVITRLMEEAIERAERKQQSDAAVKRVLARRASAPALSTEEILLARDALRSAADAPCATGA
ncbi:MAG: hypothetical protein EPN21_09810 [Methylococcaceae bacterium]|nr:MAG: hypothetical protein EPN21_09810 [Methylococcaceae bacterium]